MQTFLRFMAKRRQPRTITLFGLAFTSAIAGAIGLSIAQQLGL